MQYLQGQVRDLTTQVLVLMQVTRASRGMSYDHLSSILRALDPPIYGVLGMPKSYKTFSSIWNNILERPNSNQRVSKYC